MHRRTPVQDLAAFDRDLAGPGRYALAGVDEAGRGPLAGPVVAAAVVMPDGLLVDGIDDSKKLIPSRRLVLMKKILETAKAVGLGLIDADQIDRTNILEAARMAMGFALCGLTVRPELVLVDGTHGPIAPPALGRIESRPVVDGDAKSYSIAAASIVAKCVRDAVMTQYDRQYPGYGFARHKGYGTREHLERLLRLGPCPIHRRSFAPVAAAARNAGKGS